MEKELKEVLNILTKQYEDITNKPISFAFKVEHDYMIPAGKKVDKITIKPILVGVFFKLQPLVMKLEKDDALSNLLVNSERDFDSKTPEVIDSHIDTVLDIITIGIHNKPGDPPEWFREMLKWNCTWKDLHVFLNAVIFRMGYKNFTKSIILQKNGMSLHNEAEIIALRENLQKIKDLSTQSN